MAPIGHVSKWEYPLKEQEKIVVAYCFSSNLLKILPSLSAFLVLFIKQMIN
jgi:hypothetical protein